MDGERQRRSEVVDELSVRFLRLLSLRRAAASVGIKPHQDGNGKADEQRRLLEMSGSKNEIEMRA